MDNNKIINGIDVSECPLYDKKTGCYHTFNGKCVKDSCAVYKWLLEHKRLQKENEKIKKQYNCYACGNCGGKEDYINLEKHHKGLRKQFDELAKRNNTLSLRIEELEKENEELKAENEQLKKPCLVMPKVNQLAVPIEKYERLHKALEEIREIAKHWLNNDWSCYHCRSNMDEKLKEIIKLTRF